MKTVSRPLGQHDMQHPSNYRGPRRRKERGSEKNICLLVFIAALFTVAKMWKQTKYSLIDEWIKKTRYAHAAEYY